MTTFDERERGEEARFRHELELNFRIRNRRNKLFGLWLAGEHLGLAGEAAADYAKDVVMADLDAPGGADMMARVRADLAGAGRTVPDRDLERRLEACGAEAREGVMAE